MQSFLNTFKEFLYLFTELSVLFIAISFLVSIINQKYEGIFKNNLLVTKFQVILKLYF
ncbi:membrane protein [Campylobacter jejuni subsp. jejuni NCTC 11168-K12E5]|uniref:Membrane protein n=1 Tax=Campylobacter jejuni subsp. jejuni serotype O:2 (strain ATCC 700819 / NCTC 11168) TaxID=192222 RepID=Q0P869_CAMJE|nr:probable membrane protein Cj1558 [imported] - Campylobacter jejuni (strain NCTC 11168) [Campylobacter jejuni]ADC29107.1 putative membrane protein [Campylobacter jejuni subsp. jejuni IA3902]AHK53026.1 membrane protein [Campylobacter jejuni subsp. jejuni NCTC 11168-K12E5]AHK54692.1 membrane protein [Campylobacter jejuni subsp. jejuni NCTC 11168-Kf1]AHK56357.1 membrane protein [Campylobacter jejuni subsp. jejuni NCTC 11168-mcK12E5]AHK58021.1 membrane protein [Campylobacter jejuni subsp. jejuni